jgi:hypothetical protein
MTRLIIGTSPDGIYHNTMVVGDFPMVTKLVTETGHETCVALPTDPRVWGCYPSSHDKSWLHTAYVVMFFGGGAGPTQRLLREAARRNVPREQWPALVAKLSEMIDTFKTRLGQSEADRYALFRPLQLMLKFMNPALLAGAKMHVRGAPNVADIQAIIRLGARGEASSAETAQVIGMLDELLEHLALAHGGLDSCRNDLVKLVSEQMPGRFIHLPAGMSLRSWLERTA